jgi:hypothetical protein
VTGGSEEVPVLVDPPLNLVLHMNLRVFVYSSTTSKILILNLETMDSILRDLEELQVFP